MSFAHILINRPSKGLRRTLVTLAAMAAFVVADATAVATERGSYYATCGHLGVPCLEDDGGAAQRAKRGCRAIKSTHSSSRKARRARRACRAHTSR